MTVDPGSGAPMNDRMQSLLSRAVEDQLSEQRQVSVALGELRAQLTAIGQRLETLPAAGGSAAGMDDGAAEAVATLSRDMREALRAVADRVDAVGRAVQQRGADLAELKVSVQELQTAMRDHTGALGGVTQALAAVPAVGERVAGLQDNLTGLHERLSGVEEIGAAVERLSARITSADQDLRELRSAFSGMAARMAELPGRGDLAGLAASGAEPLQAIGSRLGRLEASVPELLERIDGLAAGVTAASERPDADPGSEVLAALRERLDELEAAVAVLPDRLAESMADDDESEARTAVAERLTDLHEALVGEGGLAARVDAAALDDTALSERVFSAVGAAVSESEERLVAHVDAAVLALAEALFRSGRKPGRAAPAAAPVTHEPASPSPGASTATGWSMPPAGPPSAADAEDAEDEDHDAGLEEAAGLDEADGVGYLDDEDDEDDEDEDDEDDEDDEEGDDEAGPAASAPPPAWQVPSTPAPLAALPEPTRDEPAKGRRRPWWRPGE